MRRAARSAAFERASHNIMAWKTLTIAALKTRISGSEFEALSSAALGSGQDAETVVEDVLSAVVKLVRGKVAACRANVLGEGDTIPDELEDAALAIARNRVFTRLPGMGALNDDTRRDEVRSAERLLDSVAACTFLIEQPADVSPQVIAGPAVEVITTPTRTATRQTMQGLL